MELDTIKSISISEGVVTKITSSKNGVIWKKADVIIAPYNEKGEMAIAKIAVSAGDVVTITYFITQNKGYIYDGRYCGLNYYGTVEGTAYPISDSDLNKECTIVLTIPEDGFLTVGANSYLVYKGAESVGSLSKYSGDIPVGKYIKFTIN